MDDADDTRPRRYTFGSHRARRPDDFSQRCGARKLGISVEEYKAQVAAGLKWCSGHKKWCGRDTFGPHPYTRDGLNTKCREADRISSREYQRRRREEAHRDR